MANKNKSALSVTEGVNQPPSVNPRIKKIKKRKLSTHDYVEGILKGDRTILGRAITLIESNNEEQKSQAGEIIEKCLPYAGNSIRIGITGVPGVGKSTFIESFGRYLLNNERKLAVLAIDPSSEKTKGSILGDKTRMETLSTHKDAFIRPSPSAGSLGGVAQKTRESVFLCEAAGYDVILIETVGVGQSETAVHSMTDFFLLLMLAGAGDELQGIKRGIMEMSDLLAITKADGNNLNKSKAACAEYNSALHLFPPSGSGWYPKCVTCSSVNNEGIELIWKLILDYTDLTKSNGFFAKNRSEQAQYWMKETIDDELKRHFYSNPNIKVQYQELIKKVQNNQINSFIAAKEILQKYFSMAHKNL